MSQEHVEELDGCDHGATGKDCREDPSTNGKDCEVHGQHGGINEDHCLSTTTSTTTAPPTTTTTLGPVATTTTTLGSTDGGGGSSSTTTTSTTSSPVPSATSGTTATVAVPTRPTELPYTGASSLDLAGIGLALVLGGVAMRRRWSRG